MAKTLSTILGIAFILVGICGFLAPTLMGFHFSFAHNLIHLVSGAVALYFGLAGSLSGARGFCIVFGAVYLLLGVVGFIAGEGQSRLLTIIPDTLTLGTMDHLLHAVLGVVFLIGGLTTRATARV